jgi:mannose-6-phosphate isomerase class I
VLACLPAFEDEAEGETGPASPPPNPMDAIMNAVALRLLFAEYLACPPDTVTQQLAALTQRLQQQQQEQQQQQQQQQQQELTPIEQLILRLNEQYPGDIGVFSPLLMNYLVLQPGDSFFIGANELHAYLSGECIECMALSDNVVRAGLTPKFRDCKTLASMLNYRYAWLVCGSADYFEFYYVKNSTRFPAIFNVSVVFNIGT